MTCITFADRNYHILLALSITWRNREILDHRSIDVPHFPMQAQVTLKELTIEQTVEQILTSHKITRNEQRWLISLCLKGGLSYQQDNLINQVYEVLRQGLLIVVD